MALINIGILTKAQLDGSIKGISNEIERYMHRWKYFSDSIASLTGADLTTLGYDSASQVLLATFRTSVANIVGTYHNEAKVGTADPSVGVRPLTDVLVF